MAWIYLAESEDSAWPCHRGLGHSPTVKTTDTLKLFFCLGCTAVNLRPPLFGTTLPLSYLSCCPETKLISSTADSPVRISVLRAMEKAWQALVAGYIGSYIASSKKLSRRSSSSKTSQQFGPVELAKWPSHLPQSGMIKTGMLYQRKRSARPSMATAGFFLPRPTAKHYGSNKGGAAGRVGLPRHSIWQLATKGLLPGHPKGALNREYLELVMGYPLQWTEIAPWVTQWYRSKRKQPSKGS